jgi:signal transduction histidine kinase
MLLDLVAEDTVSKQISTMAFFTGIDFSIGIAGVVLGKVIGAHVIEYYPFCFLLFGIGVYAGTRSKNTPTKKKTSEKKTNSTSPALKQKLEVSERIQRSIAQNFPDGIVCVLDKKMQFTFVGGQEVDELKKPAKDWIGKTLSDNFHPAINLHAVTKIKKCFDGEVLKYEVLTNNKAYLVNSIPILDSKNAFQEVLIIIRNITGTIKLENNLKRAQEKEKEFNVLRSRFVTLASHEFRTPLSTILTSVFLLENYAGEDYEQEKKSYIDKIKRAVHNLTGLLNDFLSVGKLEEGKIKVAFDEFELKPLLEDILQEVVSIKKVRQDIVFKFEAESDFVMTDKNLLKNIVMNLLTNAVKYSAPKEEIQLDVLLKKDFMKIKVRDKGTGIPETEQSQIFKRFFRGQNANNIEGTGLGLNLVKKYIRLLKGNIEFTSQVDKGSTFIVTIPIDKSIEKQAG